MTQKQFLILAIIFFLVHVALLSESHGEEIQVSRVNGTMEVWRPNGRTFSATLSFSLQPVQGQLCLIGAFRVRLDVYFFLLTENMLSATVAALDQYEVLKYETKNEKLVSLGWLLQLPFRSRKHTQSSIDDKLIMNIEKAADGRYALLVGFESWLLAFADSINDPNAVVYKNVRLKDAEVTKLRAILLKALKDIQAVRHPDPEELTSPKEVPDVEV